MMTLVVGLFTEHVVSTVIAFIAGSDSWIKMLAMLIGAFWVITAFMETAITKCMELVFVIPGQVFTWIGASFGSNVGQGVSNEVGSVAQQGLLGPQSPIQQAGGQLIGNATSIGTDM